MAADIHESFEPILDGGTLSPGIKGFIFKLPSDSPRSGSTAPPGTASRASVVRVGSRASQINSGRAETGMSLIETSERIRANPLDEVERVAATHDWSFERAGDDEITMLVRGKWADYQVSFTWMFDLEAMHLACAFEL